MVTELNPYDERVEEDPVAQGGLPVDVGRDTLMALYYRMLLVRRFEEMCIRLKEEGMAKGPLHLCIGQEAAGIGATAPLRPTDTITSTHRGHAHYLGKGADPNRLMAEILGRETGYGKGKAGHMLIADVEAGLLAGSGIVGGMIPVAVGQALSYQIKEEPRIAVCFFGDGAANEGTFGEGLNLASVWKLPVVFLCENNHYGLTVPTRTHLAGGIARRATGYDMPGKRVDGNDVLAVYRATREAARLAREGGGPTLIEAVTYRQVGFSTGDRGGYQPLEEIERWKAKDPLPRFAQDLRGWELLPDDLDSDLQAAAIATVDGARAFAEESPFPDSSAVMRDVFIEQDD